MKVIVTGDGILFWGRKKPGKTRFSGKSGMLTLFDSSLLHAGDEVLDIPIRSIVSCGFVKKLGGMTSYLSVEYTDSAGKLQAASFSDGVRMPKGKHFEAEINSLTASAAREPNGQIEIAEDGAVTGPGKGPQVRLPGLPDGDGNSTPPKPDPTIDEMVVEVEYHRDPETGGVLVNPQTGEYWVSVEMERHPNGSYTRRTHSLDGWTGVVAVNVSEDGSYLVTTGNTSADGHGGGMMQWYDQDGVLTNWQSMSA